MGRSNNKNSRENTAFVYVRLSRDDDLEGESYSISNQKKLLLKVAKDKGYNNIIVFCDDGVSGITMNRPEFTKMIEQLKIGKAAAVFVKDLSRLGRNYIEVGRLTEEFFPENRIRLVSVSDNLDTDEGENELTPIKNLFNEWYSRDISKKRRISNKIKGSSGIPLSFPPYGYIKDDKDLRRWLIDDEAAYIVRRIFNMSFMGMGDAQIADTLSLEKILTPVEYAIKKGIRKPGGTSGKRTDNPYLWNKATISKILSRQEYCGDIINFKTYSLSYKNKKRHINNPEDIMIFKDVNEPIIDREMFESIRSSRKNKRKRADVNNEDNIFSGLLRCADCGRTLHYHKKANRDLKYYNCPGYNRGKLKDCYTSHHIRLDFLKQVVLAEIRRLIRYVCKYEEEFLKVVNDFSKNAINSKIEFYETQAKTLCAREKELDRIFERLYEDNISGKISDERFKRMSIDYDKEQMDVQEKIKNVNDILDELSGKEITTQKFVEKLKKYTRTKKLTPYMLRELIEHIEVYHIEKTEGVKKQKIVIHYNCIGAITIPEELSIAKPDIKLETRQGVEIEYLAVS